MAGYCCILGALALICFQWGNPSRISTDPPEGPDEACDTSDCILAAAELVRKMNFSADPCQDFNEFACGRAIREFVIPEGSSYVSTITVLHDENKDILHDIIIGDTTPNQPRYLSNIKHFYRSCVDDATIESVGLTPYFNDTEFVDDWPTLNPSWSEEGFNLNEALVRYNRVLVNPIFVVYISNDITDNSRMAIYLTRGDLGMAQEYYRLPRNGTVMRAYENYLVEVAVALNASREEAERDARDVVDLETELAKIMVPREHQRDFSKMLNPVKLNELSSLYPQLDIAGTLTSMFSLANITLADDEKVINHFPTYIGNISLVLARFHNRTIQNLFGFRYALSRTRELTRRMRDIQLDFDRVYVGNTAEKPRWDFCVESTSDIFWKGLSKQFVIRRFSERAKRDVNDMIDNLKEAFMQMIEETTWMGESTKEAARTKLAAMKRKIGYPDVDFEEADIEKLYEKHTMKEDDFYNNRILGKHLNHLERMSTYRRPVDKNEFKSPPHDVNAYFSFLQNEIVFLAGIMQEPFYSETFQDYMNYGAIGTVIGHEITHGFDDRGSQFDENGTLRNWWAAEDRENFARKATCIINQNSNIHIEEINMNLNGRNTQGESMADRGGLKEAFSAYKNHVSKAGLKPRLTGLHLSQDQVFFLSFAQMHCAKMTREELVSEVTTRPHPPGKYRLLGALQNSEDFAKAYNCSQGSFMNPVEKCNVW